MGTTCTAPSPGMTLDASSALHAQRTSFAAACAVRRGAVGRTMADDARGGAGGCDRSSWRVRSDVPGGAAGGVGNAFNKINSNMFISITNSGKLGPE